MEKLYQTLKALYPFPQACSNLSLYMEQATQHHNKVLPASYVMFLHPVAWKFLYATSSSI